MTNPTKHLPSASEVITTTKAFGGRSLAIRLWETVAVTTGFPPKLRPAIVVQVPETRPGVTSVVVRYTDGPDGQGERAVVELDRISSRASWTLKKVTKAQTARIRSVNTTGTFDVNKCLDDLVDYVELNEGMRVAEEEAMVLARLELKRVQRCLHAREKQDNAVLQRQLTESPHIPNRVVECLNETKRDPNGSALQIHQLRPPPTFENLKVSLTSPSVKNTFFLGSAHPVPECDYVCDRSHD